MTTQDNLVEKAREFAKKRHEGQFRRDGVTPYFEHCEKVASLVKGGMFKAIAYCHDLLEDDIASIKDIHEELGKAVLNGVLILTHTVDISYTEYLKTIGDYYKRIKISDIVANLTDSPTLKQVEKYNKALRILAGV